MCISSFFFGDNLLLVNKSLILLASLSLYRIASSHGDAESSTHHQMSTSASGESYFGIEELGSKSMTEDRDVPLTWRGILPETMSDWTIVVCNQRVANNTYHVHKSVLCYGPRQSRYMSKLILNHQSSSSSSSQKEQHRSTRTTKVELDQRDADNVPISWILYTHRVATSCSGTVATSASTITTPSLLTAQLQVWYWKILHTTIQYR
jgi:hypothetical protein